MMAELIGPNHMLKSKIQNPPNFNIVNGSAVHEYSKDIIEGQIRAIEAKHEASTKPPALADFYRTKHEYEVKRNTLAKKLDNTKATNRRINAIIANDKNDLLRSRVGDFVRQKLGLKVDTPKDHNHCKHTTVINIQKKAKRLNYAPGGEPYEDEYGMSIPQITACTFYEPLHLLLVCFIDGQSKLFEFHTHSESKLDIHYVEKSHKVAFVPQDVKMGLHRVCHEVVAIFVGENRFEIAVIDPNSNRFLEVVESKVFPKEGRLSKLNDFWCDKDDFVTSLQFDESNGVLVTWFCGYFKMYEPIHWNEVWYKDVNKTQSNIPVDGESEGSQPKMEAFDTKAT